MKKTKMILLSTLLTISSIAVPFSVLAAENTEVNEEVLNDSSASAHEYWENVTWDIIDISASTDTNMIPKSARMTIQPRMAGEWIQSANGLWWYRHSDGGYMTNGWEFINNCWFYFDAQGWMMTGWVNDGGTWYHCAESGAMEIGWIRLNDYWYYLNISGAMLTGWFHDGEKYYYSDETNGRYINNTGTRMIQDALQYVGNPYVWGGNSLTNGIDCSGYTQQIYSHQGIGLLRVAADQYNASNGVSWNDLLPGDLVFYSDGKEVSHVAFYIGKYQNELNCIVQAANSRDGIIVSSINRGGNIQGYGTFWRS